jgi:sec-independent protein translocase protein TatB
MFNVGGAEVFVILLVALVVLGPDKLPGAMRSVGNVVGEMRKLSNGFQSEMRNAMNNIDRPPTVGPTVGEQPTDQTPTVPPAAPTPPVAPPSPTALRQANESMFRPSADPADQRPSFERPPE